MLEHTSSPDPGSRPHFFAGRSGRHIALLALLALLLSSGVGAGIYKILGAPKAVNPALFTQNASEDQVQTMVKGLAERLQANPDNPQGWAMLARSYKVMGRLDEAEAAFTHVGDLINTDPNLMVDYAQVLSMRAHSIIEGRPLELVNKALSLNPNHPTALMLSGVAAYHRDDFKTAIAQWEKLLAVSAPDAPVYQQTQAHIAKARSRLSAG